MTNTLLVWLVAAVILLSVINVGYVVSVNNKIDVGVSESELNAAIDGIVFPEYSVNLSGVESRLDSLELEVAEFSDEDVSEEDEAERLVLAELDTKSFKKDVLTALNNWYDNYEEYNCSTDDCAVESYRHITDIVVKDLDVEYGNEEAEVTVDLKIYYYLNGDEDETERARLVEFDFEVEDLDEDEDFVDDEVDSYPDLEVAKVY